MRYRRLIVHGHFWTQIFKQGALLGPTKCIRGLPADTKFAYAIPSTLYGIELVIESSEFAELKDGDEIPRHEDIYFESITMEELEAEQKRRVEEFRKLGIL